MKRILNFTAPRRLALFLCLAAALCLLSEPSAVLGYHFFYKRSGSSQLAGRWKNLPVSFIVDNTPASFLSDAQTATGTGFDGNTNGRFVINGLPPGSYKLIVEPMGANDFA